MIAVAEYLEGYEDFFKDVACIKATFVLVCERPQQSPDYILPALWKTMDLVIYKATRPDCDNYAKPIQDAISHHIIQQTKNKLGRVTSFKQGARIIPDDSNLVDVRYLKVFRKIGEESHIKIFLKEVNPIYKYE